MSVNTNSISVGEVCTIKFAKYKNITNFDNIKLYDNSQQDDTKTSSICLQSEDKSIAYENCALKYNNPYFVSNTSNNKYYCKIPETIDPIKKFISGNNKDIITSSNITSHIYNKYLPEQLYEEKWHDWFCIPNYHFGNNYYNNVGSEELGTKSVGICYGPCSGDYIPNPYNVGSCIIKTDLGYPKFNYTPLALICLFGLNEDIFKDKEIGYPKYIDDIIKSNIDNIKIKLNNNDNKNKTVIDYIKDPDNNILNGIWDDIKSEISKNINNFYNIIQNFNDEYINENIKIPDHLSEFYPKYFSDESKILFAYKLAERIKKYYNNINEQIHEYNYQDYKKWKKGLYNINNYLIKEKLKFHVKIIKHCINICFDGNSEYSKKIFEILKTKYNITEPIKFDDKEYNNDPEDDEIIANDFKIIKKKDNLFESYTSILDNFRLFINIYAIIFIIMFILLILYIIYCYNYEYIIQNNNVFYNNYINDTYYNLRKTFKWLISGRPSDYFADDTDKVKIENVLQSFQNNSDKIEKYKKIIFPQIP
jgi:hypothetical protein